MSLRRPADEAPCWLIAYDVASDRRRRRVVRILLRMGVRIQFSVFEVHLAEADLARVLALVDREIHPREDRVDVVGLCGRCVRQRRRLGTAVPEGPAWQVW